MPNLSVKIVYSRYIQYYHATYFTIFDKKIKRGTHLGWEIGKIWQRSEEMKETSQAANDDSSQWKKINWLASWEDLK